MQTIRGLILRCENAAEFLDRTVEDARSIANEMLLLARLGDETIFSKFVDMCHGISAKIERFMAMHSSDISRPELLPIMREFASAYLWFVAVERAPASGMKNIIEVARNVGANIIKLSDEISPRAAVV